jgi:hypothetical protein
MMDKRPMYPSAASAELQGYRSISALCVFGFSVGSPCCSLLGAHAAASRPGKSAGGSGRGRMPQAARVWPRCNGRKGRQQPSTCTGLMLVPLSDACDDSQAKCVVSAAEWVLWIGGYKGGSACVSKAGTLSGPGAVVLGSCWGCMYIHVACVYKKHMCLICGLHVCAVHSAAPVEVCCQTSVCSHVFS